MRGIKSALSFLTIFTVSKCLGIIDVATDTYATYVVLICCLVNLLAVTEEEKLDNFTLFTFLSLNMNILSKGPHCIAMVLPMTLLYFMKRR